MFCLPFPPQLFLYLIRINNTRQITISHCMSGQPIERNRLIIQILIHYIHTYINYTSYIIHSRAMKCAMSMTDPSLLLLVVLLHF